MESSAPKVSSEMNPACAASPVTAPMRISPPSSCGLRVPMDTPENTRVESRFAGSDANPYLAMAGTLACGLLGIRDRLQPMPAMDHSAQDAGFALPRSLNQALDGLEGCAELQALLGPRFVRAYISVKRKEYETFFRVISSWEREFLLLNV